jgi:predicted Fe-Mo cluster-binding NifX family protein
VLPQGRGTDATIDPRFGRCPFFVLVDLESMAVESVPIPVPAQQEAREYRQLKCWQVVALGH